MSINNKMIWQDFEIDNVPSFFDGNSPIHENVFIVLGGDAIRPQPPTGYGIDASFRNVKNNYIPSFEKVCVGT